MSPLVTLTLLGFGTVVVVALLAWTLLSLRRSPSAPPAAPDRRPTPQPRDPTVTNDVVRGARVRPPERPRRDDPFESFLRANDDDR